MGSLQVGKVYCKNTMQVRGKDGEKGRKDAHGDVVFRHRELQL
jgi:hypothetical protein